MSRLLEFVYQPRCSACNAAMRREMPLCLVCAESLYPTGPACRRCAVPAEEEVAECARCKREPPPYASLCAPYRYGGELAAALRSLKFGDRPDIARQLSPLLALALHGAAVGADVLVPVPLSWRRTFSRGFNQSDLLLAYARRGARLSLPIERGALVRRKHTRPQTGLSAAARKRNVAGAFGVRSRRARQIANKRVLLFDDVATTGATLAAATRALLSAGARRVDAMCVARAE